MSRRFSFLEIGSWSLVFTNNKKLPRKRKFFVVGTQGVTPKKFGLREC